MQLNIKGFVGLSEDGGYPDALSDMKWSCGGTLHFQTHTENGTVCCITFLPQYHFQREYGKMIRGDTSNELRYDSILLKTMNMKRDGIHTYMYIYTYMVLWGGIHRHIQIHNHLHAVHICTLTYTYYIHIAYVYTHPCIYIYAHVYYLYIYT